MEDANDTTKQTGASKRLRANVHPRVSLVTTCKGRLHHLKRSLPYMLAQSSAALTEVIVVDYGCPDGTAAWCEGLKDSRLRTVKAIGDTRYFHRSRAKNIGAMHAKSPWLAFMDADILPRSNWLEVTLESAAEHDAGLVHVADHRTWDRYGTCLVRASVFHQVRGYDQGLSGWGVEDVDFYDRCAQVTNVAWYGPQLLRVIRHDHAERMKFAPQDSIYASHRQNMAYLQERTAVNAAGYG